MPTRSETLARLQEKRFDLLVLGGGVTGAGIARDAALRGLTVALVEKGDLAGGTSTASSKLIHGGLRYLEQYQFGLVAEGTRERALLMRMAPHLARPLPFLFPVYKGTRVSMFMVACGMWLYDIVAMFRNYKRHRMLNRKRVHKTEPTLDTRGLRGAALYYDCMTDDGRLTLETALDAEAHGAAIATYTEATRIVSDETGNTEGLMVRDVLADGEPFLVRARVTVVAAGPWTDRVLAGREKPMLRPTKGSHIVIDQARLPVQHAIALTSRTDGRVLFTIPWGERTIVGTTDTDETTLPDEGLVASADDVDYLLAAVNSYFPQVQATREDVISTWTGLRPLMADTESENASDVSREHQIINLDPGLLAIVGGKLTTYRLMAEQVVDRALKKLGSGATFDPCRTEEIPLPGASDLKAIRDLPAVAHALAEEFAIEEDVALHLVFNHGLRARDVLAAGQEANVRPGRLVPDLPYLVDEVVYAARHEKALRLDDVLRRRTLIFLKAKDQGLGCCEEAAEVMGEVLAWDPDRVAAEVTRYQELVAASRSYRETVTSSS